MRANERGTACAVPLTPHNGAGTMEGQGATRLSYAEATRFEAATLECGALPLSYSARTERI